MKRILSVTAFAFLVSASHAGASTACHTLREAGNGHIVEGAHYTQRLPGFKGQKCWFRSRREVDTAIAAARRLPPHEEAREDRGEREHTERRPVTRKEVAPPEASPKAPVLKESDPLPRPAESLPTHLVKTFTVRHVPEFDRPSSQPADATFDYQKRYFTYSEPHPLAAVPADTTATSKASFEARWWPEKQPEQPELRQAIMWVAAHLHMEAMHEQLARGDAR